MRDHGVVEMVIRTERRVVAIRLIVMAVLFGAFSVFLWVMLPKQYVPWAIAFGALTWLWVCGHLLRMLATGTAFILTDRGLFAHIPGFDIGAVDFVAWDEIDNANIVSHGGPDVVELELRDIQTVLARQSAFRRAFLRSTFKQHGWKTSLFASFGEGGAARLLQLIQPRIAVRDAGRAGRTKPLPARPLVGGLDPESETDDAPAKPFARLWTTATIVYIAGMAIVFYLESRGYWDWVIVPRRSLFAIPAPLFLSFGLQALYTGKVSMKNFTFYRIFRPTTRTWRSASCS